MVGLLLVSHGRIAESFLEVSLEIVGPVKGVQVVSLAEPIDEEKVMEDIQKARKEIDQGDGILILTDMFGGTPSNISLSFMKEHRVEVVTGLNLPMLIKLASLTEDKPLEELAPMIRDYGQRNIKVASEILPEEER